MKMNVVEYKKIKETNKNILAKIKNLYYYNRNFCDSFLAEHSKEDWRIQLNAKYGTNQKKIFLSKSQIEFLIEKMRENLNQEKDYYFGIKDKEGVRKETGKIINGKTEVVYYKIMIENTVMKGSEKARYPFSLYIKDNYIKIPIERDAFFMFLFQAKETLENIINGVGAIPIKAIYDLDEKKEIYKREYHQKTNNKVEVKENNKEAIQSENSIKIDENKILTQNEKINIAKLPLKGLTVKEIILKLKTINKDEVKTSLEYLIKNAKMNNAEYKYIKMNIGA
jgi:hypothetical protein